MLCAVQPGQSRSFAGKLGSPAAAACTSIGASEGAQRCHHGLSAAYIAGCAAPPATGSGRSKAGRKLDGQPVRCHAAQSCRLGCSSATGIVSRPALGNTILSATTTTPQRLRLRLRQLCLPESPQLIQQPLQHQLLAAALLLLTKGLPREGAPRLLGALLAADAVVARCAVTQQQ